MLKEELCKPSEKFLQAIMALSDKTIKACKDETIKRCKNKEKNVAYEKFLSWTRQENEVAVFTTYAYADLDIPKQFNCIFHYDKPELYNQTNYTLTQSIFEGWYPMNRIDHGHKHLCILTFENSVPEIFNQLHYETKKDSTWAWDAQKILGLCQIADIQSIIDRHHKETELKKLHGENWYEFYDES